MQYMVRIANLNAEEVAYHWARCWSSSDGFMIFWDNLAALSFHSIKIYWNTTTITWTILNLDKYQMYIYWVECVLQILIDTIN